MLTRDELLAARLDTTSGFPEEDVEVPGLGTVRVRGLSRLEVLHMGGGKNEPAAIEQRMLHLGVVEPALSEAEARQWQKVAAPSEIEPVTDAITRLSGLAEGAAKSEVAGTGAEPGTELGAPDRRRAGDDRGAAASGDVL